MHVNPLVYKHLSVNLLVYKIQPHADESNPREGKKNKIISTKREV